MSTVFNPATGAVGLVKKKRISASFVRPSNTTAYAAGDAVGPVTTPALQTLAGAARFNGGSGRIVQVQLVTNLAVVTNGTFNVYFFNTIWTPQADNAAETGIYTLGGDYLQGRVTLPILVAESASAVAAVTNVDEKFGGGDDGIPLAFQCASGNTSLYALIIATAAYVPASAQPFKLSVIVEQD